eukprot:365200-Chlamydomonas_euryale.AAC.5
MEQDQVQRAQVGSMLHPRCAVWPRVVRVRVCVYWGGGAGGERIFEFAWLCSNDFMARDLRAGGGARLGPCAGRPYGRRHQPLHPRRLETPQQGHAVQRWELQERLVLCIPFERLVLCIPFERLVLCIPFERLVLCIPFERVRLASSECC